MSEESIEELLNEALNSEIKAKEFYLNASAKAQSSMGKKMFEELAEFEQNHYDKVKKIIESRSQGVEIKSEISTQTFPVIRAEVEGELEPNKDEIAEVINLAIESEKNAQERYKKISNLLDDEEGKKIFSNLADDERNHQRILEDQFYQISNKGTIIWE